MLPETAAIVIQKAWRGTFTRLLLYKVVPHVADLLRGCVTQPVDHMEQTLVRVILKYITTQHNHAKVCQATPLKKCYPTPQSI